MAARCVVYLLASLGSIQGLCLTRPNHELNRNLLFRSVPSNACCQAASPADNVVPIRNIIPFLTAAAPK